MSDFTLRVTLELGSLRREFEVAELAAVLALDDLEPELRALLFRGPCPHLVNKRKGGRGEEASRKEGNDNENRYSFVREGEERERGCRGKGREEEIEASAAYLAERLDDAKSLALYRCLVRTVPAEVIRDCLVRALDLPAAEVRRSRAAYFTALCLPHLRSAQGRTFHTRQP